MYNEYREEDLAASRWLDEQYFDCFECDETKKYKNLIHLSSGELICKDCDIEWESKNDSR